jgi:hypothetical protein
VSPYGLSALSGDIHGIQVSRALDGSKEATKLMLPTFRGHDRAWHPAITFPDEMRRPIADLVLEALVDTGVYQNA